MSYNPAFIRDVMKHQELSEETSSVPNQFELVLRDKQPETNKSLADFPIVEYERLKEIKKDVLQAHRDYVERKQSITDYYTDGQSHQNPSHIHAQYVAFAYGSPQEHREASKLLQQDSFKFSQEVTKMKNLKYKIDRFKTTPRDDGEYI